MEDCLVKVLNFLPHVKSCCFCVSKLKTAAVISSIVLFLFHNNAVLQFMFELQVLKDYHHWRSAIIAFHSVVFYVMLGFSVVQFVSNILVFCTFCIDLPTWLGLLFVLVSLLCVPLEVIWTVIAGARHFFEPGLFAWPSLNTSRCNITIEDFDAAFEAAYNNKTCFDDQYKFDYVVFGLLIVLIFYIYLIIVVYSHFKQEMAQHAAVWSAPSEYPWATHPPRPPHPQHT